ncbi:Hypothetical protein, putative [Bodo saltans]|uniref:Uncharacterized protein n=1 Tax=Bodo saltans TaxID=75058 RepID=A0A0S4ISU0_BODSA|nr:Hypothetical protein, putative [Bodo saltans]|eukprot:CUG06184.1 Hypothetical protein, putative [Bodo saltans]
MTTNMNIDDLRYAVPMTAAAITVGHGSSQLAREATAYAPLDERVVDHASHLLRTLPLSCVTTRTLPIAAFGVTGSSSSSASRIGAGAPNPRESRKVNYAKEKWNSVSFAADRQAIQFHEELTSEVMALRRAWKTVNTKVVFPDTVPDEALTYFQPPEKFGQGWEMFDAKKHIDILALDRIATQRQNSLKEAEARKERREDADQRLLRSVSRSPSRRSAGGSSSPMRRPLSNVQRNGSNVSPSRAGSSSPMGDISTAAHDRHAVEEVDVRRLVSDEQVANLFYEDEVAKEIESLKWDFKEFRPPQEWKERHSRRMAALTRRAAEWRPMEWKREVVEEVPQASRVTSIPAVAPFFSSGVPILDPKLPIPASMQGSGISRSQLDGGLLKDAFVIRPDAQKAQKFATTHLSDGSTSKSRATMAPVVVEGMTWGDIMVKTEELSGTSSL